MQPVRVYDLPTRVFHWSFAGLFVAAYAIATLVDDESARFAWHMLAGLTLGVAVLLRIVWGVVGTRHARFSDLRLDPRQLVGYLKSVVTGGGRRWTGHNPASSWAAVSMIAIALALGVSGLAMAYGVAPEWVEDGHELLADLFLVVALLHVAGLVVHSMRHRDALPAAMVSGRKREVAGGTESVLPRPLVALVMLAVLVGTGAQLVRGYDTDTQTLAMFGTRLVLGEDEGRSDEGAMRGGREHGEERDEH